MTADKGSLLEIENLDAWYRKDSLVLSRYSMALGQGEVTGLIGLNGAGKTTLMLAMAGILPTCRAQAIRWHGDSASFRSARFRLGRYIVFAEDASFRYFTFREYLEYAAASYGKRPVGTSELIDGFHFGQFTDVLMKDLSSGNLRKAYLITAFALRPELLLLDEPVNGLDFESTEYLYRTMREYRAHGTLFFSSHILESLCRTADRILVLQNGHVTGTFRGDTLDPETIRETLAK